MKKIIVMLMAMLMSVSVLAREYSNPKALISVEELNEIKDQKNVVVIDYRWDAAPSKTIPGAVAVTTADLSKTIDGVKFMAISKEEFENAMSKLGVVNTDTVVVTGDTGNNSTRLWWLLKLYGHQGAIRVLDGSVQAWEKSGLPMEAPRAAVASKYVAKDADKSLLATIKDVKRTYESKTETVIDTRSTKERVMGHVPGSTHIEWTKNLTPVKSDGKFKSADKLQQMYTKAGVTPKLEGIYPHCRAGWRSAHTMFVLVELLGYENVRNYDGSWFEYEASGEKVSRGF